MSKEYVFVGRAQLKTRDYIHQIEHENRELKQEIERLNNNWNALENYIRNKKVAVGRDFKGNIEYIPDATALSILDYMKIFKGSDKE